jgi:hypothetical protein
MSANYGPASMQDALGESGQPPQFTVDGKTYTLGFPTQKAKAILEELVAQESLQAVRETKAYLSDDEYKTAFADVLDQIKDRQHRTWGALWRQQVTKNGLLFPLALFRLHHPDMTATEMALIVGKEPELFQAAFIRVMPDFFDVLAEGQPIPAEQKDALKSQLRSMLSKPLTG